MQQSSKVIISLPGGDNSLQNILNPLSVSTMSDDETEDEEFNSFILPSFGTGATFPVNCYLVAVGAQNSDVVFSRNYCGRQNVASGKIDRDYEFGPFVGLFSSGSNVEIDVPAGDKRIIYVFGIHALNPAACSQLSAQAGENPDPENFSYPHIVGRSATFAVAPGQTSIVPINLNQPVVADRIDGCIIPALNDNEDPVANKLAIERDSFPQNILITARTGESAPANVRCDFVDIVPKYEYLENAVSRQAPARVGNMKMIRMMIDGSPQDTFPDKVSCESSVFQSLNFPLLPTEKKVRRWLRLPSAWNMSTKNMEIQTVDGSLTSNNRMFDFRSGTLDAGSELIYSVRYIRAGFDIVIPEKVIAGQCYQMFVIRKAMEDETVTHSGINTPFVLGSTSAANVQIFNAVNCTGGMATIPAINSMNYFTTLWFRASGPFDLTAAASGAPFTTPIERSKTYEIKVSSIFDLIPTSVELIAPEIIRQRTLYSCSPILFRFKNSENASVPNQIFGNLEILLNQSESDPQITFYDNDDCSSSPITSAPATVPILPGSEYRKIYMKTFIGTALGKKTIRFKVYDGIKIYFEKYEFEVTNPNN